jgi:predicted aminopeptidase
MPLASGCYLGHLAVGQARLLRARLPIEDLLADPSTPEPLRAQLARVEEVRRFAAGLGLDVGDQYTSYVPWPGDRVVTVVVRTRAGEIEPAGFWFPIVGRVPYKGFFDPERARAEGERLRRQGYDVCEVGVRAYSTLGWLDDPVTGAMLREGEGEFAETLLHELVHATAYVPDQARFNEGAASFLGQEASVAFYAGTGLEPEARERRRAVEARRRFDAELGGLRAAVEELYAAEPAGPAREAARAALEAGARQRLVALLDEGAEGAGGAEGLRLNDACLALSATYAADLEGYARLLVREGGDLRRFVARFRAAAEARDPLAALLGDATGAGGSRPDQAPRSP